MIAGLYWTRLQNWQVDKTLKLFEGCRVFPLNYTSGLSKRQYFDFWRVLQCLWVLIHSLGVLSIFCCSENLPQKSLELTSSPLLFELNEMLNKRRTFIG